MIKLRTTTYYNSSFDLEADINLSQDKLNNQYDKVFNGYYNPNEKRTVDNNSIAGMLDTYEKDVTGGKELKLKRWVKAKK